MMRLPAGCGRRSPRLRSVAASGCAIVAALLAPLMTTSPAFAGIIELGRKGQRTQGSQTTMNVAGREHTVVHDPNQPIEDVLQAFIDFYAAQGFVASVHSDPNDPNMNAMEVTYPSGAEVQPITVHEDDANIHPTGAFVSASPFDPKLVHVAIPDAIAGNGNLQIRLAFRGGPVNTYTVTTAGKSLSQVVEEMVTALSADVDACEGSGVGFSDTGVFDIRARGGDVIDGVRTDHTDTGISDSGAALLILTSSSSVPQGAIPTLGTWGMVALAGLLAGVGLHVLRRRAQSP